MKIIAHVDADCFYVSCERVRSPQLIGKPVGVLGNQGAFVIAVSYEMKQRGVIVGAPVWQAKKICPEAIFIRRDFHWYAVLSSAMQEVFASFSDMVEYYSIDESFIDFGNYSGDLNLLAEKIQKKVLKLLGLPVSVGISLTRTLAKIASSCNKPNGIKIVDFNNLSRFLKFTPVSDVPGIGIRLIKRLPAINVNTAWDYVNKSSFLIKRILNKPGEQIWYELRGVPILPVRNEHPPRKCLSRGGSLWGHPRDRKYIWGFMVRNLERFVDVLWRENIEVKKLIVVLTTSSGLSFKHVEELQDFTNSYKDLFEALKKCFFHVFMPGSSYFAVHVLGEPVKSIFGKQLNIFCGDSQDSRPLDKLRHKINKRFGVFAVRSGATAYIPEVFRDKTSDFEICDIEGKFCF